MAILDNGWHAVREFHLAFGHPAPEGVECLDLQRVRVRAKWMLEEVEEFLEAGGDCCEQADAMIDLIYFALGTLVEMGVRPDKLFEIVHRANMSKLWPDGLPHYAADGKTVKPDGWQDPRVALTLELERQASSNGMVLSQTL